MVGREVSAGKRRVRGILETSDAGRALKSHLFACAHAMLGPWAHYLDPDHCENRALVIEPRGFISTHKDSREGDLTCVHFLTGNGSGQPVNSVGICARIWGRLPKLDNAKSQRALGIDYGDRQRVQAQFTQCMTQFSQRGNLRIGTGHVAESVII